MRSDQNRTKGRRAKATASPASGPAEPPGSGGPAVPESNAELNILQSLRRIIRAVDIHSHALANRYGVTGPQLVCLATLGAEGPLTATELSRRVFVSASTITGIIDRLERHGLVERRRDEGDRRRVLLRSTRKGSKLVKRAPLPLQEQLMRRVQALPEEERAQISASLQRVVDLMEARRLDASPMLTTGQLQDDVGSRRNLPGPTDSDTTSKQRNRTGSYDRDDTGGDDG